MKIGILLTNLGTPKAPTKAAVKAYLAEFLSDPLVVGLPAWIWQPLLRGIILPIRSKSSAHNYKKIWRKEGSPLLYFTQQQATLLQAQLGKSYNVVVGMRYGEPSLKQALNKLSDTDKIIVLPLYPQYSTTTSWSTFKKISALSRNNNIHYVEYYFEQPEYISAVANSIESFWKNNPRGKMLLFSFHGLPEDSIKKGDPYYSQCLASAKKIAAQLNLPKERWQVVFQSRFGFQKWLQPYCDKTLITLAQSRCQSVDVVCPGFPADCLETLEEIAMQNRNIFLENGGKRFQYIPALNESSAQTQLLQSLIETQTQ